MHPMGGHAAMAGGPGGGEAPKPAAQPRDLLCAQATVPPAAASWPYPSRVPGRTARAAWLPCLQGLGPCRQLATLLFPVPGPWQPFFLLVFRPTCSSQADPAPSSFH